MFSKKSSVWVILILLASIVLAACATPAGEIVEVEVTREVEVEVLVEVEVEVPVEVEVTREVEVEVEVEVMVERPQIRVAYPSTVDMEDIPSIMASQLLAEMGYAVTPTFFAQSELAVEALARGDADFGNGADRTFWAAISKGADIVTLMEQSANGWAVYTVLDIETCADLDGRRFAQHSEGAVSKAMSDAYLLENCPDAEPDILIIPGSENRAAALLAGEIDATPVELADAIQIDLQRPGEFHVLANFAVDVPELKTTLIYTNGDFAAEHPEVVKDYIRALLTVHRQIQDDPAALIAEASKWLGIDPEVLPLIVEAQFAINSWDVNGGLDEAGVQFSIDFFTNAGRLDPGLTVDGVADLSYLREVLDEIGEQ